jgi:hypothetical protein
MSERPELGFGRSSGKCRLNYQSLIPILVAASVVVCSPPFALAECSSSQPSTSATAMRHIVLRPGESRFRLLPLTNYVNTAFDTAQVSRAFSQDDYWHNHERVNLQDQLNHVDLLCHILLAADGKIPEDLPKQR